MHSGEDGGERVVPMTEGDRVNFGVQGTVNETNRKMACFKPRNIKIFKYYMNIWVIWLFDMI